MKYKLLLVLITGMTSLIIGTSLNLNQTIQATTTTIDEEEVNEKLEAIEIQVSAVLTELYRLEQLIQESNEKIISIEEERLMIQERILEIEAGMIQSQEELYQYEATLGQVLSTYQRMGSTSFLEIILDSKNLSDFLGRLTLFRDMTQGTGELISKADAVIKEMELAEQALLLEAAALNEEEKILLIAIEENNNTIEEQELFLASLEEERAQYEAELNTLKEAWLALKPVFKNVSVGFSKLASSGALSQDMIEVDMSLFGITGTITESDFNQAIKDDPNMPLMVFTFTKEGVAIDLNNGVLKLMGYFEVEDDYELHYKPTSGQFYGIDLETSGIDELYEEGALILDVEILTGGYKVKSVETKENEITLNIAFSIFNN